MKAQVGKLRRKETAVVLVVLALIGTVRFLQPRPVQFDSLQVFTDFAVSAGYTVQPSGEGYPSDNCYVSDHPASLSELLSLTKRDCGMTSAWRGVIWAYGRTQECPLAPGSIGGKWRIWGNVLVAGDERLMDEVERRYRHG